MAALLLLLLLVQALASPSVLALLCLLPRPGEMDWFESLVQQLNSQGEQAGRAVLDLLRHPQRRSTYQDSFPLVVTGQASQQVRRQQPQGPCSISGPSTQRHRLLLSFRSPPAPSSRCSAFYGPCSPTPDLMKTSRWGGC